MAQRLQSMTMAQEAIEAVSVIVTNYAGDRVLLVQRGRDPGRGLWAFSGGRIEPGETPATAAARELFEETGIVVSPEDLVFVCHRFTGSVPPFRIAVHHALSDMRPDAADDAADARFVTLQELETLPLVEGIADLAMAALTGDLPNS